MITIKSIPSYVCYAAVCHKGTSCDKCTYSKNICKTQNQKWLSKRTEEDILLARACMGESEEIDPKNTQANAYLKTVLAGKAVLVGRVLGEEVIVYGIRAD